MQKTTPLGCWIEEFSRFTFFENTISNSPNILRARFLEKDGLFCFIVYASFTASRTFLQQLLACLNFRIRRFILLLQTKKVISMNYGSSTSSWKPWRWVRLDLIFSMRDIYINSNLNPLTKFPSSSRSTKFEDILLWNVSQMITKNVPISTTIVISYSVKWGIPLWIWWKVNGNWDTTWSEVPNGGKVIVEQILASEERKKSKRAGQW